MDTYCVWARVPRRNLSMPGKQDGWSRVAGGLTREEAEWFADTIFFQARAMADATPGRTVPISVDVSVTWDDE